MQGMKRRRGGKAGRPIRLRFDGNLFVCHHWHWKCMGSNEIYLAEMSLLQEKH